MKTRSVLLVLAVMLFSNQPIFAQAKEQLVKKQVTDILNVIVEVSNFVVIRNGGEVGFDINIRGIPGHISFSQDYLLEKPEKAGHELLTMYKIKTWSSHIKEVGLWNAHWDERTIVRYVRVGDYQITLQHDWSTVERDLYIDSHISGGRREYGYNFYIALPEKTLNKKLIQFLIDLTKKPFQYTTEFLWGLEIDVFERKGDSWWTLKGYESTIKYNPRAKRFKLGGKWKENAKITQVDPRSKIIWIKEGREEWVLKLLDTKENRTCSAYKAMH